MRGKRRLNPGGDAEVWLLSVAAGGAVDVEPVATKDARIGRKGPEGGAIAGRASTGAVLTDSGTGVGASLPENAWERIVDYDSDA
jgi:hypothetical protein